MEDKIMKNNEIAGDKSFEVSGGIKATVVNIMSKPVISIGAGDSLHAAVSKMKEFDIGSLPVLSNGEPVGMITDRDIIVRALSNEVPADRARVGDYMTAGLIAINPAASPEAASSEMRNKMVRRLPVMDGHHLIGMVSLGDLANTMGGSLGLGQTLSGITDPTKKPQ